MTDDQTPSATLDWRDQDEGADAASDRTSNPSVQQVNRSREQELGVGRTEINAQRDPTTVNSAEQYGAGEGASPDRSPDVGGGAARPSAGSDRAENLDDVRDHAEGGEN